MEKIKSNDLQAGILDSLKESGAYSKLQAQVFEKIFHVMNENSAERPELPEENVLVNSLIRDYLNWNNLEYTDKVLSAETGDKKCLSRDEIAEKLNVTGDFQTKPLLYSMVEYFLKKE